MTEVRPAEILIELNTFDESGEMILDAEGNPVTRRKFLTQAQITDIVNTAVQTVYDTVLARDHNQAVAELGEALSSYGIIEGE